MPPSDDFRLLRQYMRELYQQARRRGPRDRRKHERRHEDPGLAGVDGIDRRASERRRRRDRRNTT